MLKRVLGHLARRMGIRRKLNYTRTIRVKGVAIKIPSIRGITCQISEPWMIDLLGHVLQDQGGAFLDAGVNVGQTLVKVKTLDRHRKYIGFEPNPVCVSYVQDLIKENSFEDCSLLPVGLFTEDCVLSLDLYADDATDSSASMIDNFRSGSQVFSRIYVPVFRFDSLAKLVSDARIGIVKIDVEGAELEVVKSLLNVIRRDKPIILIEVLPVYSKENDFRHNRQVELERIFSDAGYTILRVEKTSSNTLSGLKRIEEIGIHSDLTQCDYVIVPREKLSNLSVHLPIS